VNGLSLAIPPRAQASGGILLNIEMVETYTPELLYMGRPSHPVGLSARCCDLLIVAGQGSLKAAGKPESSEGECSLGVSDMV
jgi:hypothetical protein